MNQHVECLRQHHGLPACPASCVYDDLKSLFRKKVQNIQRMGISSWTKLFHTIEQQVNWIVGTHEELASQCTPALDGMERRQHQEFQCASPPKDRLLLA